MALLMEAFPSVLNLELKVALAASARRTVPRDAGYPVPYDRATGFGMLQVGNAIERVEDPSDSVLRQFILEEFQRAPEGEPVVSPVVKPS